METTDYIFWGKSKYWWMVLLPGILLIPCGCWFLFTPSVGYLTITTILLWMLILIGVIQLLIAFSTARRTSGWGWWLAGGILDLFIGFVMLGNIAVSALMLPYFFAFVFLYKGVSNLISAFSSMSHHRTWWLYLFNALLLLIMSVLFFTSPFSALITIDLLIGISFIYWGISLIFFSLDLRPGTDSEIMEPNEVV